MRNPEPVCCGDPMIHNSFTSQYECSVAYLVLHDEGIDPYGCAVEDLEPEQQAQHMHWMESRRPDGDQDHSITRPKASEETFGRWVDRGAPGWLDADQGQANTAPKASPTFNPAYRVARCGDSSFHPPHVVESGPDQPRNCPGMGIPTAASSVVEGGGRDA